MRYLTVVLLALSLVCVGEAQIQFKSGGLSASDTSSLSGRIDLKADSADNATRTFVTGQGYSTGQVSGGDGVNFFFDDSTQATLPATYHFITRAPVTRTQEFDSALVNATGGTLDTVLIESYASDSTTASPGLGATSIDAGAWRFNIYAGVSSNTGVLVSRLMFSVFKRTALGVETALFSVTTVPIVGTTLTLYETQSVQPAYAVNATDRLVVKVYGITTRTTNTYVWFAHNGSSGYSYFKTPIVTRHNQLAGLSGGGANDYQHLSTPQVALVTGAQQAAAFADSARANGVGVATFAKGQPVYAGGADSLYSAYTVTPIFAFGFGSGAGSDTTALTATGYYGYFYNKTDSLVITSLMCVMQHGVGTDTMAVQVSWDDSLNGSVVTTLNNAAYPVNSITTGNEDTSFDNAVIPPGMWVRGTTPGVVTGRKPVSASWTISGYFRKAR